jgi:UDP-N-acetylmuramoyl-tripeptide--D-alanyl-D-alanine ligase
VPELSLAELAQAAGGTLIRGEPETRVVSFAIHTGEVRPGGAFFALKGERTDGHEFLGQAARAGAVAAVVRDEPGADEPAPPGLVRVDDPALALGRCGSWVRTSRLRAQRCVAITGSNGKTTTKELLAEGLAARRRVHRTPGNLNNQLGVPLTLLACPQDTEILVLELAMRGPGQIAELTRMTRPDVGLITNVRAVHMQFFQSPDDIAAAKGELFALLGDEHVAVFNMDDAQLRVQAARHAGPRIAFGRHPASDLQLEGLDACFVPGTKLEFRHRERHFTARLRMGGGHAAYNALAALGAVVALDEDLDAALARIEQVEAGPGRGRVHPLRRGMTLIDDSYNSSPPALASVLDTLKASRTDGRKVLVIGDMLELGPVEGALHREAGKRAAAAGVELLVAVGPLSRQSAESARRSGVPQVHHYADSTLAAATIGELVRDGDLIVVKGSRGMRLERVVEALTSAFRELA